MARELSNLQNAVLQSEIRSMTLACNAVCGINLAQGICDCPLPPPVGAGAKEAIDKGINTYTRYDGLPELRAAIAGEYRRFYGMSVDAASEIVVSCGATGAFYCSCLALLNPGDEVIVFEPYYGLVEIRLARAQHEFRQFRVAGVGGPERRGGAFLVPGAAKLWILGQQRAHLRGVAFADGVEELRAAVRGNLSEHQCQKRYQTHGCQYGGPRAPRLIENCLIFAWPTGISFFLRTASSSCRQSRPSRRRRHRSRWFW